MRVATLEELGGPAALRRPRPEADTAAVDERAREIVLRVRRDGDEALRALGRELDGVDLPSVRVPDAELRAAPARIEPRLRKALELARRRVFTFARAQRRSLRSFRVTRGGVTLGQRVVPLERAGVYVPGGRYPLLSTAIMGVAPARAAGVREVAVATPPGPGGAVPATVLAACAIAGADEVYAVGGAQAVAALAYGTSTVRPVDKVVGPGNVYVQAAKALVSSHVGVDLPAGPSEALVFAAPDADPVLAAWDLVAQCEHDPRALGWLVTWSRPLAERVAEACRAALDGLATRAVAEAALAHALAIVCPDERAAVAVSNAIGPEHLAVHAARPRRFARALRNYGALFLGAATAVPLGDFVLGPNHTLPTGGASRFAGGLSALHFVTVRTVASVTPRGLARVGPAARRIAAAEGLDGHARAIACRNRPAGREAGP